MRIHARSLWLAFALAAVLVLSARAVVQSRASPALVLDPQYADDPDVQAEMDAARRRHPHSWK